MKCVYSCGVYDRAPFYLETFKRSQREYAARIGADYRFLDAVPPAHRDGPDAYPHPSFLKRECLIDFLSHDCQQMAYLDTDVAVAPTAPDIFLYCQAPGLHAHRPRWARNNRHTMVAEKVRTLQARFHRLARTDADTLVGWVVRSYFNAGIVVLDRASAEGVVAAWQPPYVRSNYEQDQLNLAAMDAGLAVHQIDETFLNAQGNFAHFVGETKGEIEGCFGDGASYESILGCVFRVARSRVWYSPCSAPEGDPPPEPTRAE